ARIRVSDQANIREQLQLQPVIPFLARTSEFVLTRGLMSWCGEMLIAASAASAARDYEAFVRMRKVVDSFASVVVVEDRSDRNLQTDSSSPVPGAVGPFAVTPTFPFVF